MLLFAAQGAVAGDTSPPCDLPDSADEHMEYKVSYMRIPIGTVDLYFSEEGHGCGLIVMETFPNIGFLRVYTEYFGLLAADGYIRESHFWEDKGDYWEYGNLERNPENNRVSLVEHAADRQFGMLRDRTVIDRAHYTSPVHNTISLIRRIRSNIGGVEAPEERIDEYSFYHEGSRETIPVRRLEGEETRSVDAFENERDIVNTEVDLDFEGVHGLRDALLVQFTADEPAVPVYVEARIVIGRVRLELSGYNGR